MEGWQVTRLPVDELGRVNPVDLRAALQDNYRAGVYYLWPE